MAIRSFPKVSIIIPTYNEEKYIKRTLNRLIQLQPQAYEIILVDGNSEDLTFDLAAQYDLKAIQTEKGRARQMNRGAEIAQGDLLCFVHADTLVPLDMIIWVEKAMQNPKIACGAFLSLMRGDKTRWFTSFHNCIKTYYAPMLYRPYHCMFKGLRLLFGDQVIFCRREDFLKVEGFNPEDVIMEEANLCLRMNKLGRLKQLNRWVESSDRRIVDWGGEFKANVIYFLLAVGWALRVPQKRLLTYYRDIR